MKAQEDLLLIIDGHALAYRAFYAFPISLTTKSGEPINTIYGFFTLLLGIIDKFTPKYLAVCFDRKEPTFRLEMYPEYKAHRPPAPPEFHPQIDLLKKALTEIGVKIIEQPGFEGDDLMGTLARMADKEKIKDYIVTGDRDSFQLISENTNILLVQKGISHFITYDLAELEKNFQLKPEQMIDLKALEGDKSDNIPGVPGIGEKTALKLIKEFTSLDSVYENLDQIKPDSVKQKIAENKKLAYLSQELAKIKTDINLAIDINDLEFNFNWQSMWQVLNQYDFKSLINKYRQHFEDNNLMPAEVIQEKQEIDGEYVLIDNLAQLKKVLPELKNGFSFDTETTGKDPLTSELIGLSFAYQEKEGFYLPLRTKEVKQNQDSLLTYCPLFSEPAEQKSCLTDFAKSALVLIKPIMEDQNIPKYTQNGKYDYLVLKQNGIETKNIAFDTMLAAYLIAPQEKVGLKELVKRIFKTDLITYEELTEKNKKNLLDLDIKEVTKYASADADYTLRLMNYFKPILKEKGLEHLFYEIEIPLQIILAEMEFLGVNIDLDYLKELDQEFSQELKTLTADIFRVADAQFNINSPKQLSEILFHKLGLPTIKKTKEGYSTNSQVLEKLAPFHELPNLLLRYRYLDKLKNTYVDSLPELVNQNTKKIHTSFNQTITITGRLSSSHPNLQNIPIKGIEGQRIRKAFVPSISQNFILSADYSQIELRVLAHISQDERLVTAFKNNEDIHTATAAQIYNLELAEVTKEQRQSAKAINFGIIYGISAYGLAENLKISNQEAKQIIDDYFAKFSGIKKFIDDTIQFVDKNKYVKTLYGRIREIPDIASPNKSIRNFAERTAVNTIIQGTAADIIKIAMIKLAKVMQDKKFKSSMLIQVHDELVFEVVTAEKGQFSNLVKKEMEQAVELLVPLIVDISIGKNWQEVS